MTKLNYFQVYSGRENHVTNNTLLMLRHVYRTSPLLLEKLLSSLLEDDSIKVGLDFAQQKRTGTQVPDGVLSQNPLHIYVEAKHDGPLDAGQIIRHLQAIKAQSHPKGSATLIGLTARSASGADLDSWKTQAEGLGIRFAGITYDDLLIALHAACESEVELTHILHDYETFIDAHGLRPDQHRYMVAFLCGTTHDDNVRTGIYYEPEERAAKWQRAHFMGIYHSKQVGHLGRVQWVVAARRGSDGQIELRPKAEFGTLPPDAADRISLAIALGEKHYAGLGQDWHRFYVTDVFEPTDFRKESRGGMMGHRYFDLGVPDLVGSIAPNTSVREIAKKLHGKTFV